MANRLLLTRGLYWWTVYWHILFLLYVLLTTVLHSSKLEKILLRKSEKKDIYSHALLFTTMSLYHVYKINYFQYLHHYFLMIQNTVVYVLLILTLDIIHEKTNVKKKFIFVNSLLFLWLGSVLSLPRVWGQSLVRNQDPTKHAVWPDFF